MKLKNRVSKSVACAIAAIVMPFAAQAAESYPAKNVVIIMPYSAGGSSDLLARAVTAGVSAPSDAATIVQSSERLRAGHETSASDHAQPLHTRSTGTPIHVRG